MRIAVLEDDPPQAKLLQIWLQDADYDYRCFGTGQAFRQGVVGDNFDLLVIDWMLPDTSGVEVLKWIRQQQRSQTPILFVTARDAEEDIVQALEEGADDYMIKPINQKEFIARLNALVRRTSIKKDASQKQTFGRYVVDYVARSITIDGQVVELTNKEFELAAFLFKNTGRILSRGYILETVWGRSASVNTRTVDTHISRVRNKLSLMPEQGWRLSAIYQHGYRLEQLDPTVAKGSAITESSDQ